MPSNVAVHTISFRGKAGAIFVTLCCAVVSFIVGYVTQSWAEKQGWRDGLWETCQCWAVKSRDGEYIHESLSICIYELINHSAQCF